MSEMLGRFIKVYMKNGLIFHGAVKDWEEKQIIIKSLQGEVVTIIYSEVCAYTFIEKNNGKFLKEKEDGEGVESEDKSIDRISSLVELHKLKAESERELARSKLRSPIGTAQQVEYDTISVLRSLANNPRKQDDDL